MDNQADEEVVLQITAEYVQAFQAGSQPAISDYLARCPAQADAIAEFISYYQLVEAGQRTHDRSTVVPARLSVVSLAAIEAALASAPYPRSTLPNVLWLLSPAIIASELNVTVEIVLRLRERAIDSSTIPRSLLLKLACFLEQPLCVVQSWLGENKTGQLELAETPAPYRFRGTLDVPGLRFRDLIEGSTLLDGEQKAAWDALLRAEDL